MLGYIFILWKARMHGFQANILVVALILNFLTNDLNVKSYSDIQKGFFFLKQKILE